jgi:hypothetical protein
MTLIQSQNHIRLLRQVNEFRAAVSVSVGAVMSKARGVSASALRTSSRLSEPDARGRFV